MRIIAFITEAVDVRAILEHIGEPASPPRIAQARGQPEWYEDTTENAIDAEAAAAAQRGLPLGLDSPLGRMDIAAKAIGFPILSFSLLSRGESFFDAVVRSKDKGFAATS